MLWCVVACGCGSVQPIPPGGGSGSDNDNQSNGAAGSFTVRLSASNPTPSLGEQVDFVCTADAENPRDFAFDFTGASGRLVEDPQTGRAFFIVSESDLGVQFTMTCTATDADGARESSNNVTVIPS